MSDILEKFPTPWIVCVDGTGDTFLSAANNDWICDVGAMEDDGTNASQEVAKFIAQAVNSQSAVVTALTEIVAATVEAEDEPSRALTDIGQHAELALAAARETQ